jgi:hypothetical protein
MDWTQNQYPAGQDCKVQINVQRSRQINILLGKTAKYKLMFGDKDKSISCWARLQSTN